MEVCSGRTALMAHKQICYDDECCPVCDMREDMEAMEEEMQHDIDILAKEIEELRDEAAEA